MQRTQTIIAIPSPLHAQLRDLAKVRKTTMVELIAEIVTKAIKAGELPETSTGFEIEVIRDSISLHHGELPIATMTIDEARQVADALDAVLEVNRVVGTFLETGPVLTVRRRGRGISIEPQPDGKVRHALSPSIARDLARQLRNAAATIK